MFAGTTRGDIFRSTDGSQSWQRVVTPPAPPNSHQYAIAAFAIDPHDPRVLHVSAGRTVSRSTDGARTWLGTGVPAVGVDAFAVDAPGRAVFAATQGAGVIRLQRQPASTRACVLAFALRY